MFLAGIQGNRNELVVCCIHIGQQKNGILYAGVPSNLVKRIWVHKNNLTEGFIKRYGDHHLVWYEIHESMDSEIQREKRIKVWKRSWKLE